jgi:hypothetical protein
VPETVCHVLGLKEDKTIAHVSATAYLQRPRGYEGRVVRGCQLMGRISEELFKAFGTIHMEQQPAASLDRWTLIV